MASPSLPLIAFAFATTLALQWWGYWVARRQNKRLFRWAARAVLPAALLGIGGVLWGLRGGEEARRVADAAPPADAARAYAQGVSGAMSGAAVLVVLCNVGLLTLIVIFAAGSKARPSGEQE
ncbi:MAG TPA: hypothetical protein VFQ61_07925 [Polyangiaceae bacterium]|nr:hypothetical protein [Polyangiaceae bacterium]